jgi:two-component system phosphate regulon sensor histidine kinase PhoR
LKTRHRIFLLLLAVSVPLAALLAAGAEWLLLRDVEERIVERLRADLRLVTSQLDDADLWGSALDRIADEYGRVLGVRVTLISPSGKVLGDSTLDGSALESVDNHSTRPEIVDAARGRPGSARRFSTTTSERMLYMAAAVDAGGRTLGYARLAVPEADILARGRAQRPRIIALFAAGLLLFSAIGYAAARRLARPFEQVAALAEGEGKEVGASDVPADLTATQEARRLAASIRHMRASLLSSLAEVSSERAQLESILTGMREGILVLSPDRRVLLSNGALADILRLPGPPAAGQPLAAVVREPRLLEAFERCCSECSTVTEAVTLGGIAGRTYEVRVEPYRPSPAQGCGAIGVFFDVTQLQALERVRREFVVNVSHELRTPLTAIRAFAETLQEGAIDDPQHNREFLAIIRKHCDRMQALINDLTDLSLIETGAVELQVESVDLAAAVRDSVLTLDPRAQSLQVSLESVVPERLRVRADPARLAQILLNLIENAVKFNRPGGRVRIEARPLDGPVEIVVSDTGVGIPSEHLERIFHRFHRVDASRSREQGGTGLGLAIVKHLVRLHGGTIRAESELGRGSRFIIELPAA